LKIDQYYCERNKKISILIMLIAIICTLSGGTVMSVKPELDVFIGLISAISGMGD
jgi:hypothetical protein